MILLSLGAVSCNIDHIRLTENEIDIPDLTAICTGYDVDGVSEKCKEQLDVVCDNVTVLMTSKLPNYY